MNLLKRRDLLLFLASIFFLWLYIPHIILFITSKNRRLIELDLVLFRAKLNIKLNKFSALLFYLHNNSYFRTFFYFRIGAIKSLLVNWYRPGCKYFIISNTTIIDGGCIFAHPYSTILNAEKIGKNFSFRHLTTIGNKENNLNRPIILDNVFLGAAVIIIGKIIIGNNVIVGAGSVITKSVPDNCIVVGNPAYIIRKNGIPCHEKL